MAKDITFATIEEATEAVNGLKSANAEMESKVDKLTKDLTTALEEVANLSGKLDLQEKHGDGGVFVTVDKVEYKISGNRFFVNGEEKTAQELSKDTAELKRMVKIGSGSLIPIEN